MVLRPRLLPKLVTAAKGIYNKAKVKVLPKPKVLVQRSGRGWFDMFYAPFMTIRDIKDTVPGDISDRLYSHYGRIERARSMRRKTYSKLVASYRHSIS